MKRKTISFVFIFFVILSFPFLTNAQQLPDWVTEMNRPFIDYPALIQKFNDFWKDKKTEPRESERKFEEDEFAIQEEYGWLRGYIRQYRELIAVHRQRNPFYQQELNQNRSATVRGGQWSIAGPSSYPQYLGVTGLPIGIGRVNQLAFSGTHPNVMYAIAPAGLFITTDTGNTWQPTGTDFMGFHQFRSVAVDPHNDSIIYIGCGDFFSSGFFDTGIIKSTDFGNTFTSLANGMDSTLINVIQIDPLNTNHLVAGGFLGIWTSNDGGASWLHAFTLPNTNIIQDIKFKPNSSDSLYATSNTEFYISTDGGHTWNAGFSNFQFTDVNASELLLGVTAAAPGYVYIATQQDFGNIYKSTDGGATFTAMKRYALPGLIGYDTNLNSFGQGSYDFTFNADPSDSLKLYIGSISHYTSNDGGATWYTPYAYWSTSSQHNRLHCDQHFVARNPLLPDRIWVTSDGGVYSKMDNDTVFVAKQNNLCVTQAYHFDADNFYDSTFALGTQDNGAYFTNNGSNFYSYSGGDMFARIYCTYNNDAAIYTAGPNSVLGASNINIHTGGGSFPLNIPESAHQEPLSLTPVAPLTAFVANTHVWETKNMNDNPVSWRKIFDNSTAYQFVAASHCLADTNIFYTVRSDGYLFRTLNVLDNQPVFDSIPLPNVSGGIPSIATVPNNPDVLYLCANAVYISTDKGLTWTDITGPINSLFGFQEIVADPFANDGSVYVAATNKIYYRNDSSSWIDYSNQLPDVSYINDIAVKKFNSQVRKVMATILDRGIWQSPVYQSINTGLTEYNTDENQVTVFPAPASGSVSVITRSANLKIDHIVIYDALGQQVSLTRNNINKSNVSLDISILSPGIYFMEIDTRECAWVKRIVVGK